MTANNLKNVLLMNNEPKQINSEEYDIPLDISDIISICREYTKLGWQIQNQVESILEIGVSESIKSGIVKEQSLALIKNFLEQVVKNPYFGDSAAQSLNIIWQIDEFTEKNLLAVSN